MPKNKDFAIRIEVIDECFRNRYKKWTLKILLESVNDKLRDRYGKTIGKRTIQDDINYLKYEKNAPIEKRKEGKETYFYYSDTNFSIKNLPINSEEINYLNDAINILRQVNDFKILNEVDAIINKLKNTVNVNVEGGSTYVQFEKNTSAIGTEYIDDIFMAIKEKSCLRITYQSFKASKTKDYIFHPYLIKEYRNRWFLIGRQDNSNSITNFALDRIKRIRNSSEEYLPNNLFDPGTYYNNLIGVTKPIGAEIQPIEIKVSATQSPYIRTKPIHHSQEIIREYKNNSILIRLYLICNYELRSVLLSFGSDLEVIKPMTLREELKTVYLDSIGNYN